VTQKEKRDAARSELLRLLKGLDFYRDWRILSIKKLKGNVSQEDLNEIVAPSAALLESFDNAGYQYRQVLKIVREWYSHTFSHLCYLAHSDCEEVASESRQFLKDFRNEMGFEFQSEAELVATILGQALKRGKINKSGEYYILKELENDVGQTLVSDEDFDIVSEMLRRFENR
jgi:hypothetical protein